MMAAAMLQSACGSCDDALKDSIIETVGAASPFAVEFVEQGVYNETVIVRTPRSRFGARFPTRPSSTMDSNSPTDFMSWQMRLPSRMSSPATMR
jgi:hypothetical protein